MEPVIPPLPVVVEGVGRCLLHPGGPHDTVAELQDAVGSLAGDDGAGPVRIDGRRWPSPTVLSATGLRAGSTLSLGTAGAPDPPAGAGLVAVLAVVGGPDAGHTWRLPPGRHLLGRSAAADLPLADPLLEPHHIALDVSATGAVRARQLCGHVPARRGDEPLPLAGAPLSPGQVLHVGASAVAVLDPVPDPPAHPPGHPPDAGPWHCTLRRAPRAIRTAPSARITLPEPPAHTGRSSNSAALAPAVISLGLALVMAALLGRPEIAWFGAMAGGTGLALWAHQRARGSLGARRDRRRHRLALDEARGAAVAAHLDAVRHRWRSQPELAELARRAAADDPRRWIRRAGDADAWTVTPGRGDVPWHPDLVDANGEPLPAEPLGPAVALGRLPDVLPGVPVTTGLGPGAVLGIDGPGAPGLARALVLQLAVQAGPADWRLLVVASGRPDRDVDDGRAGWAWASWLPHLAADRAPLTPPELAERLPALGADERHLVVVALGADLLEHRTSPVRRLLAAARSTVAVAVVDELHGTLPAWCTARVTLGTAGRGRLVERGAPALGFHAAGAGAELAGRVAQRLAGWRDPELGAAAATLPDLVRLADLLGPVSPSSLAERWSRGLADPEAPIGLGESGPVHLDLAADGPHALVAGTTGAGKSELLRSWVCGMAVGASPEHLAFVLVDYKGGAAFDICAGLPHVVGVVTDLDEHLGARVLQGLEAELRRREAALREAGATDLAGWRRLPAEERGAPMPRLVVVVDEFATLAVELPDFLGALVAIAQRGRSLGVHLILATQRPGSVVRDDVRANTNLRVALRVQSDGDALDVVGDATPASFPRHLPGRALVCLGGDERITFQAAIVSCPYEPPEGRRLRIAPFERAPRRARPAHERPDVPSDLEVLVRAACDAAALVGLTPLPAPWLPPLPERLTQVPAGAAGVLDDPARQRQLPLAWEGTGHLLVLGGRASGVTATLVAAVRVRAAQHPPRELHVYGVDGRGDGALARDLDVPHVGDVVSVAEHERLRRLLVRITDDLDERRLDPAKRATTLIVAVDGWGGLRAALEPDPPLGDALDRIVAEGSSLGVVLAVGAERPGLVAASFAAACEARWVHRLADPLDASSAGVRALAAGAPPGRLVDAASGLEGHVLAPDALPDPLRAPGPGPSPIRTLPTRCSSLTLVPVRGPRGALHLPVGIAERDLREVALDVPRGEHVMVLGPAGSGRSTALARLADGWRALHPRGPVVHLRRDPGTGPLQAPDDVPWALVVDDAELVDDADGTLERLLGSAPGRVTCFVAARPDALRGAFGHWTSFVRRSGLGLVLGPAGDLDGDLLGYVLPRRWPLRPRPGLGWLVQRGEAQLVQVADLAGPPGPDQAASSTPSVMCTVRSQ